MTEKKRLYSGRPLPVPQNRDYGIADSGARLKVYEPTQTSGRLSHLLVTCMAHSCHTLCNYDAILCEHDRLSKAATSKHFWQRAARG